MTYVERTMKTGDIVEEVEGDRHFTLKRKKAAGKVRQLANENFADKELKVEISYDT